MQSTVHTPGRYAPALAGVLPVPGFIGPRTTVFGPGRVEPAEPARVAAQPVVRRRPVPGDVAAEVDGETPAVLAGARMGGETRLLRVDRHLLVVTAVGVGDADGGAELPGVRLRHLVEGGSGVGAQLLTGCTPQRAQGRFGEMAVAVATDVPALAVAGRPELSEQLAQLEALRSLGRSLCRGASRGELPVELRDLALLRADECVGVFLRVLRA